MSSYFILFYFYFGGGGLEEDLPLIYRGIQMLTIYVQMKVATQNKY